MPTPELYFEDFYIGQLFHSAGSIRVTAEEIKEFGQKYDPQPFHLDEAAGEASFLQGPRRLRLAHRRHRHALRVESIKVFGGMIGAGVEEMRWTEPVRPGDTLRTEIEVVSVRHSASPARTTASSAPAPSPTTRKTKSSCAPPSTSSPPSAARRLRYDPEDLTLLQASEDRILAIELTSGEQFFAEIVMVVDQPPTPDVFLLRVTRAPDGAFEATTSSTGESILLADIARRSPHPLGVEYE